MSYPTLKTVELESAVGALLNILELGESYWDIFINAIESKGIDYFLDHPEEFSLSSDVCGKIEHIKIVLAALKEGS